MADFNITAPTNVTSRSVQLNGQMVTGGPDSVRFHWGGSDGLQVEANWAFHMDVPGTFTAGQNFSVVIPVNPGQIYFFTVSDQATPPTQWASTTFQSFHVFSTPYEPQNIPNALSGGRLLSHIRTPLGAKYAEAICPTTYISSITSNLATAASILTWYAVNNAFVTLDYSKDGSGHRVYTETFSTNNDDGSPRFSYSPTDAAHPPNTSQFGQSGLILPNTPLFQGIPFPVQGWVHRKGLWRFDITSQVDATAPPVGGGAHYPLSLWALPRRTLTGEGEQRRFWQGAVAGNNGSGGPVTTTVYTWLRSCCYWVVYIVLGVDTASAPNGSHICSFSVQATRQGP